MDEYAQSSTGDHSTGTWPYDGHLEEGLVGDGTGAGGEGWYNHTPYTKFVPRARMGIAVPVVEVTN